MRIKTFLLAVLFTFYVSRFTLYADDQPAGAFRIMAAAGMAQGLGFSGLTESALQGATETEISQLEYVLGILTSRKNDCFIEGTWITDGYDDAVRGITVDCTSVVTAINEVEQIVASIKSHPPEQSFLEPPQSSLDQAPWSTPGTGAGGLGVSAMPAMPAAGTQSPQGAQNIFDGSVSHGGKSKQKGQAVHPHGGSSKSKGEGAGASEQSGDAGADQAAPGSTGQTQAGSVGAGTTGPAAQNQGGESGAAAGAGSLEAVGTQSSDNYENIPPREIPGSQEHRVADDNTILTNGAGDDMFNNSTIEAGGIAVDAGDDAHKPFSGAKVLVGVMDSLNPQRGHQLAGALYAIEPSQPGATGATDHWIGVVPLWDEFRNKQIRYQVSPLLSNQEKRVFNVTVRVTSVSQETVTDAQGLSYMAAISSAQVRLAKLEERVGKLDEALAFNFDTITLADFKKLISRDSSHYDDSDFRRLMTIDTSAGNYGPCAKMPEQIRDNCIAAVTSSNEAMNAIWELIKRLTKENKFKLLKKPPQSLHGNARTRAQRYQQQLPVFKTKLGEVRAIVGSERDEEKELIETLRDNLNNRIEVVIVDIRKAVLADANYDLGIAINRDDLKNRAAKLKEKLAFKGADHQNPDLSLTNNAMTALRDLRKNIRDNPEADLTVIRSSAPYQNAVAALMKLNAFLNGIVMNFIVYPSAINDVIEEALPVEGLAAGAEGDTARYVAQTLPIFRPIDASNLNSNTVEYFNQKAGSSGGVIAMDPLSAPFLGPWDQARDASGAATEPLYRALVIFDLSENGNILAPARTVYFDAETGMRISSSTVKLGRGADGPVVTIESLGSTGGKYQWKIERVGGQSAGTPPASGQGPAVSAATAVAPPPDGPPPSSAQAPHAQHVNRSGGAAPHAPLDPRQAPCSGASHGHVKPDGQHLACYPNNETNPGEVSSCNTGNHPHNGACYPDADLPPAAAASPEPAPQSGGMSVDADGDTIPDPQPQTSSDAAGAAGGSSGATFWRDLAIKAPRPAEMPVGFDSVEANGFTFYLPKRPEGGFSDIAGTYWGSDNHRHTYAVVEGRFVITNCQANPQCSHGNCPE